MSAGPMYALNNSGHLIADTIAAANRFTDEPLTPCWHCNSERARGRHANRGLCARCYRHWQNHGFRGDRPPPPQRDEWRWVINDPLTLRDFALLDNPSIPGRTADLCRRFGVSRRTLSRMRARIRQQRQRAALLATSAEVCGRERWRRRLRPGVGIGREMRPYVGSRSDPVAAMVAATAHDSQTRGAERGAYFRA